MTIDLTPYQLKRPEKVDWQFEMTGPTILESVKSKGLRSFLRRSPELLAAQNIEVDFEPLTESSFTDWLPYYQAKMTDQGYNVIASPEWYSERVAKGWQLFGLWFKKDGVMVGSAIMSLHDGIGNIHFKASDRIDLSSQSTSSLGAVIDFLFAENIQKAGATQIFGGRSRNAFGVHNTLGYLDFKLRFGYVPIKPSDLPLQDEVPLNEEGVVVFCAEDTQTSKWGMYALAPADWTGPFDAARFATQERPFEIISYQTVS